jgi:hypothetical protein
MEVDGGINKSATIAANGGTLQGTGNVGSVSVTAGGTLAPGYAVGSITSGTLTANGPVSLDNTSTFSIRLGLSSAGTDSDQLVVTGANTFTLNDSNLAVSIFNGANINPPTGGVPTFYAIILGGAGGTGGSGLGGVTDVFSSVTGATLVGNSFTLGAGWQFTIEYAVTATGASGGNDIGLEMTAIPEPGTWAMLLSGAGMLVVWQQGRRRRK